MLRLLIPLSLLAALAAPAASAVDCPKGEKAIWHGEGLARAQRCVPEEGEKCGPCRKFQVRMRDAKTGKILFGDCLPHPDGPAPEGSGGCACNEQMVHKGSRKICTPGPGMGGNCGMGPNKKKRVLQQDERGNTVCANAR